MASGLQGRLMDTSLCRLVAIRVQNI